MNTITENVVCVYDENGALVALLKRDEKSGKKIVYVAAEASIEEITHLINPEKTLI